MTHPSFLVRPLAQFLSQIRVDVTTEEAAQRCIADALIADGRDFDREYKLDPKNRIDFLVRSVGIEVKIGGSVRDTAAQIKRYLAFDEVRGLVLATNGRWAARNTIMHGKPFAVVNLGAAWL